MKRTMKDLAEELGISRTTVSLVLKGKADQYRISMETQKRILDLVEKEGYKPNYFAQGLNNGKTMTIGVIFPDVFEEFMVAMIRGIGEVMEAEDYTMILMTSRFSQGREKKNIEELLHRGIDGMLLIPSCDFRGNWEKRIHLSKAQLKMTPLVQIDRVTDSWQGSSVVQDDRMGGIWAAEYLQQMGCREMAVVSLDLSASSIRGRITGFASIIPEYHSILLKEQNRQSDDLNIALEKMLLDAPNQTPRGFFVTTAGLAIRVKEILLDRGLSLNKDYFLVRFGEDPQGYRSGMACIGQPHYEMGREAARLLVRQIQGGKSERRMILPVSSPQKSPRMS
ncbi:LacI family DNA-binding transcriptional regulator [Oceanispirochaeta sp.]|jgi:LacI family transcriptional regulator|uniref:LacI family DNA-binding transcriptional regulator n=1 Tax=Oceanispirochaeta sp. TaxID=2035350 RepID=UPI00262E2192|nr:LacI family DNA-binding transcriptional regulator [Oceanispirochaeta sp.]MDA3957643.1 LacI family DNA-binding transcriptional regulator [Oceanispirochaeta sp.]